MTSDRSLFGPRAFGVVRLIVSGGQTGADRAALDWALAHGVDHGGWCPKGRKAEDGVLEPRYRLCETAEEGYLERTRRNVLDSDATLIVNLGDLDGGTLETMRFAERYDKPVLMIQADAGIGEAEVAQLLEWLCREPLTTLNVAGPRESKRAGVYQRTWELLERAARGSLRPPPRRHAKRHEHPGHDEHGSY